MRVYRFNTGIAHSPVGQPIVVGITRQRDVLFLDSVLDVHGVIDMRYDGSLDEPDAVAAFVMHHYQRRNYNSSVHLEGRHELVAQAADLSTAVDQPIREEEPEPEDTENC